MSKKGLFFPLRVLAHFPRSDSVHSGYSTAAATCSRTFTALEHYGLSECDSKAMRITHNAVCPNQGASSACQRGMGSGPIALLRLDCSKAARCLEFTVSRFSCPRRLAGSCCDPSCHGASVSQPLLPASRQHTQEGSQLLSINHRVSISEWYVQSALHCWEFMQAGFAEMHTAASAGSWCSVSVRHMPLKVTMPAPCVSRGAVWAGGVAEGHHAGLLRLFEQSFTGNAAFIQRLACCQQHMHWLGPVSVRHMPLKVTMPAPCVSRGAVVVCAVAEGHHVGLLHTLQQALR